MSIRNLMLCISILACGATGALAQQQAFNLKIASDDIIMGNHVMGPRLSTGDFKGKVVLLDFWGVNCPTCAAAMPSVIKWNNELKDFGLIVMGPHVQAATPDKISSKARSLGVNFTVIESVALKPVIDDLKTIPHVMLFDHEGKCIYRGLPAGGEAKMRAAVGAAVLASLEKPPSTKAVKSLADALKNGQPPLTLLPRALPLLKSPNAATAKEAEQLVGKLMEAGKKTLDEANALREDDPREAFFLLEPLPASFKGTSLAAKATSMLSELKKNKTVAKELQARTSLTIIKQLDAKMTPLAGKIPPTEPMFQRLAAAELRQMTTELQKMKKTYPDAKATEEALAIGERYGVQVK